MAKLIELYQDKFAYVDDEDFDILNCFKWYGVCKYIGTFESDTEVHKAFVNKHVEIYGNISPFSGGVI